jgi:hypothetical protein
VNDPEGSNSKARGTHVAVQSTLHGYAGMLRRRKELEAEVSEFKSKTILALFGLNNMNLGAPLCRGYTPASRMAPFQGAETRDNGQQCIEPLLSRGSVLSQ